MEKFVKEIIPYIIIIVVVVLIRSFIITPVEVDGASMENTLHDGELLLLSKISYKVSDIKRFDIVVINKGNDKVVKRVIGLPGDKVEYVDNKLYINDEEVKDIYAKNATEDFDIKDICMVKEDVEDCTYDTVLKGTYLVLGDNRLVSADSRANGFIKEEDIVGKAVFRIWPLNKIGFIK